MSLAGKHALVTGSSRGIGRGIGLKLAERGARIAVHYYQNEDAAKTTLAKIREVGSDGFLVQADVCRPEEVSRIFKEVKTAFGSLDIFVSAGDSAGSAQSCEGRVRTGRNLAISSER